MPARFPQNVWKARRQGFTLVEITLALGIVAFAVIVSFGLVSTASQSFRDTRRDTVFANILQYAAANANLTPFADLGGTTSSGDPQPTPSSGASVLLHKRQWNFDMEGLPLADDAITPPTYRAVALVGDSPLLPNQQLTSPKTRSVAVVIADAGIKMPDFSDANPVNIEQKIPKGQAEHIAPFYIVVGDLGK